MAGDLDNSVDAFNKAVGSYDARILPSAKRFTELGITAMKEPPGLEPVKRTARPAGLQDGTHSGTQQVAE
jgi:DNA recombination protein RmuC